MLSLDPVDADVEHRGARLDPIALDHLGLPDRRDHDVAAADHVRQVLRPPMSDRHRAIGIDEQLGHGPADDVRTADHHRFEPAEIAKLILQQHQATQRRAGHEAVQAYAQPPGVDDVEPIDVFVRIDRGDHLPFVHVLGQGQLDENAVHVRIRVESDNAFEQFAFGCIGRELEFEACHIGFGARLRFRADVNLAGRIFSDQHHG